MTPRERFVASINFQQPDDMVAMFEIEFQIYGEYVGEDPVVGHAFAKLSPKEKERALHRNAEIFVEAAKKAGHDAIRDLGGYWETAPGVPALLWLPTLEDRVAQMRAIRDAAGGEFMLVCTGGGMVGTIPDGNSIYDFVERVFESPDEVHAEAEANLQAILKTQRLMREAGAEAVINSSDLAFNNATFLSPEQLDTFFFPYLVRWAEACRAEGMYAILHSDGNLNGIRRQLLSSGIHALQCIDPLAHMDIGAWKREADEKLMVIGNIDCSILHMGTPEQIDALCKTVVDSCKTGGGFALGGCNAIFKGISAENYQAMVDARKKYGTYRSING